MVSKRWLRSWAAELTGNKELLKKKSLKAKRSRVTNRPDEALLEKLWFYNYVDRSVRAQLRMSLTAIEMDAMALVFDRFSTQYPSMRLARLEFVQVILNGAGEEREEPLTPDFLRGVDALFEHAKVFFREGYIIPGKEHPYLAERYKRTLKYKMKQVVIKGATARLNKVRGIQPLDALELEAREEAALDEEGREQRDKEAFESETICLRELLLCVSFWKQQANRYPASVADDAVNAFFRLFDAAGRQRWTEGEFAAAMRVLLEGVYISDYEDSVAIPVDCDPSEREKEEDAEAQFKSLEDMEREEQELRSLAKRKNLIEQYLDAVFDDIDKARMGTIDLEDFEEWLEDKKSARYEFAGVNEKGESNLVLAFNSVGAKEQLKLSRAQFYALVENSHLFSHDLGPDVELKLFELSRSVARKELDIENTQYITVPAFRAFLRNSPDKRIASMVVRVGRAVKSKAAHIDPRAGKALLDVMEFQQRKPKFRALRKDSDDGPGAAIHNRKALRSKALLDLKKSFIGKSPLECTRIAPLPDASGKSEATAAGATEATEPVAQGGGSGEESGEQAEPDLHDSKDG